MDGESFGPVGNNGQRYLFIGSKFARDGGGWYNTITWLRVPDCFGHKLDFRYRDNVDPLRIHLKDDAKKEEHAEDALVDAEQAERAPTDVDAHDVIAGREGRAGSDIGYELAVDDVENLVSMGASNASMGAYTDESDPEPDAHGADIFMEVEMVA